MGITCVVGFHGDNASSAAFGVTTQAGDIIFIQTLRGNSQLATIPAGYTVLQTVFNGGNYSQFGYKISPGGETSTGSFGQTAFAAGAIYRGINGSLSIGPSAQATALSTSCLIPALTLQDTSGNSWVVGNVSQVGTVALPANMTLRGASNTFVKFGDTNGGVTSWTGSSATANVNNYFECVSAEIKFTPATVDGVGSTSGTGAAAAVGSPVLGSPGTSAGIGAASAASQIRLQGVGSSAGTSSADATGVRLTPAGQGDGRAVGTASVSGRSPSPAVGASVGSSTTLGTGGAKVGGVGTATGSATVAALSILTVPGVGSAAGSAEAHGGTYQPSRIIVGRLPSGSYGMRVSNPGYDASLQPIDDQKLIFSSEWPDVMPIHARGSFLHRGEFTQGNTETQEIAMPNPLGYVPFCDFTVRGMGNAAPAGSDIYPATQYYPYTAMTLLYWDGSGNVTTAGDANAYLRLHVTDTKICARSFVRWINGSSTQGIPRQWMIYYTIYRKQAK